MTILELPKDALLALTDTQLEQLIGRLAEAEVAAHGGSVADVRFSGSITAPDGGVDIRVDVKKRPFESGFIPRANTVFQSKKHRMPVGAIASEMVTKNGLSAVVRQQADLGGAYLIVSLADDCAEPELVKRVDAMKAAMASHPGRDAIHLDFYDRSKLYQWLRQHPGVMLWVRAILGQPLSGWKAYGRWSNVPNGASDELIFAPGVSVILPGFRHQKLTIEEAIGPARTMVSATTKAIRVTGLSGVGKTRFVQALFDETVGDTALDRTSVIYTDTGEEPVPSARQMIDQLVQAGKTATVVIDNCPPDLHAGLASRISNSENRIKLITVEYDIREDKPQTTEVVHIEADGPEIAEALVLRRFPKIGPANARRVAMFSSGNTRVALAIAERVEDGESLANLSDADLFDRLFQQRKGEDGRLREHSEVLSLTYSFAVEGEPEELSVLGSICGSSGPDFFRSAQVLIERHIAQKRGRWRAILPHAIANSLAASALTKVPMQTLRTVFEDPAHQRLLISFAHRLGLMHEHQVAQQIVQTWLADGGMLTPITALDEVKARILDYVAPVCPELLLDRIESEIGAPTFDGFKDRFNGRRTTILGLLVSVAYEPTAFDRCMHLLLRMASKEDPSNDRDSIKDKIVKFFQPYLSGTHASPEQRAAFIRLLVWSGDPNQRELGIRMLSTAISSPPWSGMGMGEFGARPRDFGYQPNGPQLQSWRSLFINIAVQAGLECDLGISGPAREVLAKSFHRLWHKPDVRGELIRAATTLNAQTPWVEGWKAVQSTISFDHLSNEKTARETPIPKELTDLRDLLAPKDLMSATRAYLFGETLDLSALDPEFDYRDTSRYDEAQNRVLGVVADLGERFALAGLTVDQLGAELFSTEWMPFGRAFGVGLVKGSKDISGGWAELVRALRQTGQSNFNSEVMAGFIEEAGRINQGIDRQILDECLGDQLIRSSLVLLHPTAGFTEVDFDRCIKALEQPDVGPWTFGSLLWRPEFFGVSTDRRLHLANMLLGKPNGDSVVLQALGMILHGAEKAKDTLGLDMRRIGLLASTSRLQHDRDGNTTMADHYMAAVMKNCLAHDGNDLEKAVWLDTLFASVDANYGYAPNFEKAIQTAAATLPEEFLSRVFSGSEEQRDRRLQFLERGGFHQPMLATADIDRVIGWCHAQGDPMIWQAVATAIAFLVDTGDEKKIKVCPSCIQYVEACPNPEQVMAILTNRFVNGDRSDDQSGIMELKADAMLVFETSKCPVVAAAAPGVVAEARNRIAELRERERLRDAAREQTFE